VNVYEAGLFVIDFFEGDTRWNIAWRNLLALPCILTQTICTDTRIT